MAVLAINESNLQANMFRYCPINAGKIIESTPTGTTKVAPKTNIVAFISDANDTYPKMPTLATQLPKNAAKDMLSETKKNLYNAENSFCKGVFMSLEM